MRSPVFTELFALLSGMALSTGELAQLRHRLAGIKDPGECLALIEEAAGEPPCPRCACCRVHRCGRASGLRRFRCLACRRTYNALTGTPLARLRKRECWLAYLQCLLDSRTVRDAAKTVGVHRTTTAKTKTAPEGAVLINASANQA